jgi:GH15 family glucan-1,4-alpha-glucosidase
MREYRDNNKEKIKKQQQTYHINNKEYVSQKQSRYREINKEKISKQKQLFSKNNSEKIKIRGQNYYLKNKSIINKKSKDYYLKNKGKLLDYQSNYNKNNRETISQYQKHWQKLKRDTDISFKLKSNLRTRIHHAIEGNIKSLRTMFLIGCEVDYLMYHLQEQFQPGMSWDNYGDWHVDHIKPCARFDLSKPEEQLKCFRYTNLQPLWSEDNLRKGSKYA